MHVVDIEARCVLPNSRKFQVAQPSRWLWRTPLNSTSYRLILSLIGNDIATMWSRRKNFGKYTLRQPERMMELQQDAYLSIE